jgi:hypothetical protein
MTNDAKSFITRAIRQLLIEAFEPEGLRSFRDDRPVFRLIVSRFGPGMSLEGMVSRVIA